MPNQTAPLNAPELMLMALDVSPIVVCSLELKVLTRLVFELASVPNIGSLGSSLAFVAQNLARISIDLNRIDEQRRN